MLRPALLLAFAIASVVLPIAPSSAHACSMRRVSVFEQADRAAVIAIGRRLRGKGIRATDLLAGTARRGGVVEIEADPRSSCTPRMRGGRDVLVFVDAHRHFVAHYQSWIDRPDAALVAALRRYVGAASDDARRAILVELTTGGTDLATDAAYHLADRPDLLRRATASERRRLVSAIATADGRLLSSLAWIAARLHDPEAVPVLLSALDRLGPTTYVEEIAIPLEVLTNHLQPTGGVGTGVSEGERFYIWRQRTDLRQVGANIAGGRIQTPTGATREHWRHWLARNESLDGDALYRLGFTERHLVMPATDDPAALAAAIRSGPDDVTRVVALDRCEQHWGRALYHFPSYANGVARHFWATLAAACEAGRPADGR
jgi:hypothetical protein